MPGPGGVVGVGGLRLDFGYGPELREFGDLVGALVEGVGRLEFAEATQDVGLSTNLLLDDRLGDRQTGGSGGGEGLGSAQSGVVAACGPDCHEYLAGGRVELGD